MTAPEPTNQLPRVRQRIGPHIESFWADRVARQPLFHAADLLAWVTAMGGRLAPSSADRVLRELKASGRINYRLEKRAGSLYLALPLGVEPPPKPLTPTQKQLLGLFAVNQALQQRVDELMSKLEARGGVG